MSCCCGGSNFNSFGSSFNTGITPASRLITVGNQSRFFPSNPCCELNARRFLLSADPCCKLRNNPPSFPVMSNNGIIFL